LRIAFRAPTETRDGELTVCDDGIGVPAPRAAAPRPRGAGLALAEALARQVGGRASITRGAGGGTVWRLTFPRPAGPLEAEHRSEA
jgi:two-component sensor histidine kinase